MIRTVAITDTETTGLSPETDRCIEVAVVLWSVEHRTILECFSSLIRGEGNAAEAINAIPAAVLPSARDPHDVWDRVACLVDKADVMAAHRAEFDRSFYPANLREAKPWLCTKFDVQWPRAKLGAPLTEAALAHGLGISHAHRALTDCLTIARLLERVAEMGHDVGAMIERGLRPKARFVALVSYDDREKAKAAGFAWDGTRREWSRTMAVADAAELPFKVRVAA